MLSGEGSLTTGSVSPAKKSCLVQKGPKEALSAKGKWPEKWGILAMGTSVTDIQKDFQRKIREGIILSGKK